MRKHYWETRQSLTPEKALQFLKEGNQRFINNLRLHHDHLELVNQTAEKQFPFAAVLSCSDSRVPVELIFDQGLGDIFSIRLAGNIASINAIGSMEFACKLLGSKLILVMGHTGCGAVKGACDGFSMGNLNQLLQHIHPAVEAETATKDNRNSENREFVGNVSLLNIKHQINTILDVSPIIRQLVEEKEIDIAGAQYDVETGIVEFIENQFTLNQRYEQMEIYKG